MLRRCAEIFLRKLAKASTLAETRAPREESDATLASRRAPGRADSCDPGEPENVRDKRSK